MEQYNNTSPQGNSSHLKVTKRKSSNINVAGPIRKKRDMISGFRKAVIICDSSDLTTSDTTTYRPNNIVVELLKKDPLRYGKATFYKFTSEKEVREELCQQFAILRNKRFWFASADQYGKLNFHHWDEWTGRNIRRWLPGSSAMYLILEGDGRKIPTLSNLLKEDTFQTLKITQQNSTSGAIASTSSTSGSQLSPQDVPKCIAATEPFQRNTDIHRSSSSASISENTISDFLRQNKDMSISFSRKTDDDNMSSSKAATEDSRGSIAVLYDTDDKYTSSSSSVTQDMSTNHASSVYSLDDVGAEVSIGNDFKENEEGKGALYIPKPRQSEKASEITITDQICEHVTNVKRTRPSSTTLSLKSEKARTLLPAKNNSKDLERCQLRAVSPKKRKLSEAKDDSSCERTGHYSTHSEEKRPTVIASAHSKADLPASPCGGPSIPFINPFLFPKSNGQPTSELIKHMMELQEKVLSNLAKDPKDMMNFPPLNAFIVPTGILPMGQANKKEEHFGTPSTGKGPPNMAFLPFGFPPSIPALGALPVNEMPVLTRVASSSTTHASSQKRTRAGIGRKEEQQLEKGTDTKCEHTQAQNCSDQQEETRHTEVASSAVKRSENQVTNSLVDVFLAEEDLKSAPYTTGGLNSLVEDIIPRSGLCEGGDVFTMFLRHPVQDGYCRSNLVAKFGDGSAVPLQLINPFTLRGTVPKSPNPGRVTVLLESAQGYALGSVTYIYKHTFINSFRTTVLSSRSGKEILSSVIKSEDASLEELLELLVYMAAQGNVMEIVETIFNSAKAKAVYSRYKDRTRGPEYLANEAGNKEVVEYLNKLRNRFQDNTAPEKPVMSEESVKEKEPSKDNKTGFDDKADNLMMLSSIASRLVTTECTSYTTSPPIQSKSSPSHQPTSHHKSSHKHKTNSSHMRSTHCNNHKANGTHVLHKTEKHHEKSHMDGFLKKVFVLPWNSKYLPSQSELCKLRATQRTYGKVQFKADMSEEEVTSRIRNSFEEIGDSHFRLAVVDQTGKLVFYDGTWTGRVIRKKLRGNSVLYVVPGPLGGNT